MKFDEFKQIVTKIVDHTTAMNAYVDQIPSDLTVVWDNTYTNNQGMIVDALVDMVFGTILVDPVYWLLYEWKPNTQMKMVDIKGNEFVIDTMDDFFAFMSANYVW